jgi:ferritin-like metal-binding protein YciE
MPAIADPRALFLHELGDILTAERTIEKMLGTLQTEASNAELAEGLERHREQTRRHVANVEEAFRTLGEQPKAEPCPGIEGIKTEHEQSAGEVAPELRDLFTGGSVARTEHYEMAVYRGLVTKAKALGERDAARLLEENLRQDEQMAEEIESLAERLLDQQTGKARAGDGSRSTRGSRRESDGSDDDLERLTVEELQKRARRAGIEGRSTMSKSQLVEALRRAKR